MEIILNIILSLLFVFGIILLMNFAERYVEKQRKKALPPQDQKSYPYELLVLRARRISQEAYLNKDDEAFDRSLDLFEEMIGKKPDNFPVYIEYAKVLHYYSPEENKLPYYQKAVDILREATKREPGIAKGFLMWGKILYRLYLLENDSEKCEVLLREAIDKYDKVIQLDPSSVEAYKMRAEILESLYNETNDQQLIQKHDANYRRASRLAPDDFSIYRDWANFKKEIAICNEDADAYIECFKLYAKAFSLSESNSEAKFSSYTILLDWADTLANYAIMKDDIQSFEESNEKYQIIKERYAKEAEDSLSEIELYCIINDIYIAKLNKTLYQEGTATALEEKMAAFYGEHPIKVSFTLIQMYLSIEQEEKVIYWLKKLLDELDPEDFDLLEEFGTYLIDSQPYAALIEDFKNKYNIE